MKLIVGLGNPGKKYENTRHNIGFLLVDKYLGDVSFKDKFSALFYKTTIYGEDVIFIKPTTFMNLSGDSVIKFVNYYNINIEDILIIQDDIDMNVGTYKLKKNSSSGGHNGIKSIENVLKTNSFLRLKIGVLNEYKKDTIDFVLGSFNKDELDKIYNLDTNKVIDLFIKSNGEDILNTYKG